MNLFRFGDFNLNSGRSSFFKIDCDALTDEDIETLAFIIQKEFRFSKVVGIPTGGTRIAEALEQWRKVYGPLLIVDDVLTTGGSMEREKEKYPEDIIIGVVIFARGECPEWIHPIFDMCEWLDCEFDTMKRKEPNFEKEIQVLAPKMQDISYAKAFYGALCNMQWKKLGTNYIYSCSWRYSGGLVASMRYKGEDYICFYCSGNEGKIREDVEADLASLEYIPLPWPELKES